MIFTVQTRIRGTFPNGPSTYLSLTSALEKRAANGKCRAEKEKSCIVQLGVLSQEEAARHAKDQLL
jgi:hypothetical protein